MTAINMCSNFGGKWDSLPGELHFQIPISTVVSVVLHRSLFLQMS